MDVGVMMNLIIARRTIANNRPNNTTQARLSS
jgi:hypothetical protein